MIRPTFRIVREIYLTARAVLVALKTFFVRWFLPLHLDDEEPETGRWWSDEEASHKRQEKAESGGEAMAGGDQLGTTHSPPPGAPKVEWSYDADEAAESEPPPVQNEPRVESPEGAEGRVARGRGFDPDLAVLAQSEAAPDANSGLPAAPSDEGTAASVSPGKAPDDPTGNIDEANARLG